MDEISPKQLEANRQNAKLGGVKTEEGKAISKYNALKHGIFQETITEYERDLEEYLLERLNDEFKPQGVLEKMLVDRIAVYYLKLFRVARAENEFMQSTLNPHVVSTKIIELMPSLIMQHTETVVVREGYVPKIHSGDIGILSGTYLRYEVAIENRLYKALHELQRIQAIRNGEIPPVPLTVDVDVSRGE